MNADRIAEQILTELLGLEAMIAAGPEVASWRFFEAQERQQSLDHGPRWSMISGRAEDDAARMRLSRARNQLEHAGLVECSRYTYSGRVCRIKLTATGKAAAEAAAALAAAGGTT
jgi:hypothetical protein